MKRLIYHWTGGSYHINDTDKLHYHYIIDNLGEVHEGRYKPEDNENCTDGIYAAHTGGGNTASVGIAFAGMFGFGNRLNVGRYPLTKKQCESGFELGAKLAHKYKLNLYDKYTVQTHYGFGARNQKSSSFGKIDIIFLPPYPSIEKNDVEEFIQTKIIWYYKKLFP